MCGANTLHYTHTRAVHVLMIRVTSVGVLIAQTSTSEPVASATQCSKKSIGNFTTSPLGPEDE